MCAYTAPGWGIGGDFPLCFRTLYGEKCQDFRALLEVGERNCVLLDSGRSALKVCLADLAPMCDEIILLPSYLCPAVLQPFHELHVHFEFYQVDSLLRINLNSLAQKMKKKVRALLIVHYFGFPVDVAFWEYWTSLQRHPALIEDCAQALMTKQSGGWLGRQGDYCITSLRKWLPVPDGALLISKRALTNAEFPQKNTEFFTKRMVGMMAKEAYFKQGQSVERYYQFYLRLLREAEASLEAQEDVVTMSDISLTLLDRLDWGQFCGQDSVITDIWHPA